MAATRRRRRRALPSARFSSVALTFLRRLMRPLVATVVHGGTPRIIRSGRTGARLLPALVPSISPETVLDRLMRARCGCLHGLLGDRVAIWSVESGYPEGGNNTED